VKQPLTCIDLFSGCGGFSLGMRRAGFRVIAAVDFNPEAVVVFEKNFSDVVPHILKKDLTQFPPAELAAMIGVDEVDVIVGGPPCQGFSTARQRDGANNGRRLKEDPRRHLYKEYLRYVEFFAPKVFVMENVLGIRTASGGEYFRRVQKEARALGYRVHAQVEDCVELGVPQKRRRQLFIGTRCDLPEYFRPALKRAPRACDHPPLWEAIGDLPPVKAGEGDETADYDLERRKSHIERFGRRYLYSVLEVKRAAKLTAHRARPHSQRDLDDFLLLKEGESSAEAMRRGVVFKFPYDKTTFKDRYTRQHRARPCSTIVAHLSKDGLMFIHPTQNRSLTPREAARVQTFPDWFEFPIARTHQFRVIGNAVPPLVGEAVAIAVKSHIERAMKRSKIIKFELAPLPKDEQEALHWLLPLLDLDAQALRGTTSETFKRAWYSIAFLYAGLHPDSALDHSTQQANDATEYPPVSTVEPRLLNPYYEQSGWPVVLAPIAKEAWRRYEKGGLKDDEFYCSEAQIAGMCYRNPELGDEVRQERERVAKEQREAA
jgi:DNA (cytosine-5)-methyltransferase 1